MSGAHSHLRPRLPPECCGFTPPPEDFFPMPPLTKLAPGRPGDLPPPPAPGDLRSRSRASLQKSHMIDSKNTWNKQTLNLALRLVAKNAPDICRAFSCCLRCCLVDFTLPFETGTGFPSVRSLRACKTMRRRRRWDLRQPSVTLDWLRISFSSAFAAALACMLVILFSKCSNIVANGLALNEGCCSTA